MDTTSAYDLYLNTGGEILRAGRSLADTDADTHCHGFTYAHTYAYALRQRRYRKRLLRDRQLQPRLGN